MIFKLQLHVNAHFWESYLTKLTFLLCTTQEVAFYLAVLKKCKILTRNNYNRHFHSFNFCSRDSTGRSCAPSGGFVKPCVPVGFAQKVDHTQIAEGDDSDGDEKQECRHTDKIHLQEREIAKMVSPDKFNLTFAAQNTQSSVK